MSTQDQVLALVSTNEEAMTMATAATQELKDRFLSAIYESQEVTLHALKAWVEIAGYFTPQVSYARLPLPGRLPKAHDIVAGSFDFAEQLLASQRRFADDVLKVSSPLLPGGDGVPVTAHEEHQNE
jgi:hypothetical protein